MGIPEVLDAEQSDSEGGGERSPWTRSLFDAEGEPDESPTAVSLIPAGMRFLTNERIKHVNFADNCCAEDQKKSSDTAVAIGKLEVSEPKNGSHLDEEFRERNKLLLNYHRHPALTRHKTPTAKKGYYVWKPYIFLQALDEAEDGDIVVWSDAGVSFLQDIRPILAQYLRGSDVTGCRTVMMEADWSKRDAFLLTDMDFRSVAESSQIASSLIIARKTELSRELAKQWLINAEDPRVMTEEDSVLGAPEYPHYHNNNDDQTAFSLNFKKFGFEAFSTGLRDEYVLLGRNLAKFIANSNAFARGQERRAEDAVKGNSDLKTREISEKLNSGQADFEVDTSTQDAYLDEALGRQDEIVRRHRDGSFEI